MAWDQLALSLLQAAADSEVPVDRVFLAPGPDFAHDCSLLAVHLGPVDPVTPLGRGQRGLPLGSCAWAPRVTLVVTYADDCVPVPHEDGSPPDPEAVTAWTAQFLNNFEAVWNAVSKWVGDQAECENITIEQSVPGGPSGQMAWREIPVQVAIPE